MKAAETTLRNLLEGTKQFQIPLFQRPFSWKKDKWQTLWDDIINIYTNEIRGAYFLGAVVTQSIPGTAEGISPFVVIDGQQRLITLSLLLAAVRYNLIRRKEKDNQHEELSKELLNLYLTNPYKKDSDFYKILPSQEDRDIFQHLIIDPVSKEITKKGQIYECFHFFTKKINKPNDEKNLKLDIAKFKTVILERLVFVNITSGQEDNPYLIFESLNFKGEDLTQADLVRNYIFMKLPAEKRERIYKNQWLTLQKRFKSNMDGQDYSDELTKALWFYLRRNGKSVSEKETYKELKSLFDSIAQDSPKLIEDKLEEIVRFSDYYTCLRFPNKNELNPQLRRWFKRLMRLDFTTCHIFLLNVYDFYQANRINIDDFENILRYLESYFVRRWFAGISTRSLGKVFNNLFNEVIENDSNNLVIGLQTVLRQYEGTKSWPSDEEFRERIINSPIYKPNNSANNQRVKFILESLAEWSSKEKINSENLTIEHIMPQNIRWWRDTLGEDFQKVHKKYLNNLGNLTLTAYNSELSNQIFKEKQKHYLESNFYLNKYFHGITTWNGDAIQERSEKLADLAIEIWPR